MTEWKTDCDAVRLYFLRHPKVGSLWGDGFLSIPFQKILRKALQHTACFVDADFFSGIEAASDRDVHGFTVRTMHHDGEVGAWFALANYVKGFGAVDAVGVAVFTGFEFEW